MSDMFGEQNDDVRTPVRSDDKWSVSAVVGEPKKNKVKKRLFGDDVHTAEDDDYDLESVVYHADNLDATDDRRVGSEEKEEDILKKLKTQPEIDRFVYGDEIINLCSPLPSFEGASVMLTNVYNTFVYIVKLKNTLLSLQNRKLTVQLLATEHHLRKLEESNFTNAHVQLPRIVESLFSMWDYRASPVYVNQLKPISCVLNKKRIADVVSFRSMEAVSKNDSNYIEVVFNNPYRFIFIGSAGRFGQHQKNIVNPFPFFGEYIDKAIADMYDVLYEMVTREIRKAKKELTQREHIDASTRDGDGRVVAAMVNNVANHQQNGLQLLEAFSKSNQGGRGGSSLPQDNKRLQSYLQCINLPLVKRENVDILITSGNSGKKANDVVKMRYLMVEKGKETNDKGLLKIIETDVAEDAVYLSSYIRCRVLIVDQPAFAMQIYTRHAIKLMTMDDRLVRFGDIADDP